MTQSEKKKATTISMTNRWFYIWALATHRRVEKLEENNVFEWLEKRKSGKKN